MCFFDRQVWDCGFRQWSHFRGQCEKECRLGDTCGKKTAFTTIHEEGPCKVCFVLDAKQHRIDKLDAAIRDIFDKTPTLLRGEISSDPATRMILRCDDCVRLVAQEMVRAWKYHRDYEGQAPFASEPPRPRPAEMAIRDIAFETWTTTRDLFDKIAARVYRGTDRPSEGNAKVDGGSAAPTPNHLNADGDAAMNTTSQSATGVSDMIQQLSPPSDEGKESSRNVSLVIRSLGSEMERREPLVEIDGNEMRTEASKPGHGSPQTGRIEEDIDGDIRISLHLGGWEY
ncbi:hypothetical protein QBC34DRAFT_348165 [Podospora aff. communis PSN243]|uniref:Stc1 domain-containing protein n=1 Tax=Podospora aff. communis PSN243 TaxID=3040156 RepID=A0AAV9GTT7_9PEZI|nr:hypothetical protein QBC34DRAFT_348165 [Podospora aff. communis PSN243]